MRPITHWEPFDIKDQVFQRSLHEEIVQLTTTEDSHLPATLEPSKTDHELQFLILSDGPPSLYCF